MNKGKILRWTPEVLLIGETLLYWFYSSPLNPIVFILLAILSFVFAFKNKIHGFVTAILFLLLNLYMCLALFSELNEFPSWTGAVTKLLLAGGTMLGVGVLASISMAIKWKIPPQNKLN